MSQPRNWVDYVDENKTVHRAEVVRFEAEKAVIRIHLNSALGTNYVKTVSADTLRPVKKAVRK